MKRFFLIFAAVSGLLAVVMGAYTSHGLMHLAPGQIDNLNTAINYQFIHTLALLFAVLLPSSTWSKLAGLFFIIGITLFSFTIYLKTLDNNFAYIGFLTPFGGFGLILGWASLLIIGLTGQHNK